MRFITFLYILLFLYIVAALVFWGMSLNKQSITIFQYEKVTLVDKIDSIANPSAYKKAYEEILDRENRRKSQYLGEGLTFLLIILIGAAVVYSSIRKSHQLNKQQKNFMLSITHELKSPIAAVKLNLQTLAKRKLDEETQQLLIHRSVNEANRLDDLCNNLLLASQIEGSHFKASEEKIDLSLIINECVEPYRSRVKNTFELHLKNDPGYIFGDAFLWKIVINNLIENAIKYSPSLSLIKISLERHDDDFVVSIADEGEGIPDEEKIKIFKKFYRVGNEISRKTKGTGLGLFLTAHIIKQHKGSITIRDNEPKGSIFEITMPVVA